MKSNLIEIEASLVHETAMAWLLDIGEKANFWVPKSAAEFDGTTLTIPEPLAQDKGMI